MSAKSVLSARALLDYPLYACDFDPFDDSRLIVGGGGGASRTGVGNKITVLAAIPGEADLPKTAELELPKDEDNVTSLAVGPRRGKAALVYAGVNSSVADQKRGQNAHFRVVEVAGAKEKTKAEAKAVEKKAMETCQDGNSISELARTAYFEPVPDPAKPGQTSDIDTYQRLVRVSAPSLLEGDDGATQLGACATGLAKKAQIALFAASSSSASLSPVPLLRCLLELDKEATDLDVIQTGHNQFQLAFCSNYQLYTLDVDNNTQEGDELQPQLVYTMPEQPTFASKPVRPAFRAIRYLAPGFLMTVCNLPKRGGVVLMGLRLPDGKESGSDNKGNKARLAVNARLPQSVPQATALAVRDLSPPTADAGPQQAVKQYVVAVGGSVDNTLSLYTVELQRMGGNTPGGADPILLLTNLYPFHTLRNVHEVQMTSIALSHVRPAAAAVAEKDAAVPPYLKLASVSVQNTVAVHYIPLRKVTPPESSSSAPRYVVALPSRRPSNMSLYLFVVMTLVLMLLGAQSILEVRGLARPVLGAREVVPASWQAPYQAPNRGDKMSAAAPVVGTAVPKVISSSSPDADFTSEADVASTPLPFDTVSELLRNAQSDDERKVLLFDGTAKEAVIQAVTHNEAEHGSATEWHELAPEQQAAWRQRLQEAGHWGENMGEAVFRGILFSELAGMVGAMVN